MGHGTSSGHKPQNDTTKGSMGPSNLTHLVKNICSGEYTQAELVQFITLVQKIALSYLKYQEVIGKRISGERLETDVEMEDLAIDCIADLFGSDGKGNFPHLKKYYENKLQELGQPTDAETLVLTRRLIVRKTKQELSRIFRERDPEGAKIVRNIKVAVRNSDSLFLFKDMGKEFIYFNHNGKNGDSLTDKPDYHFDPLNLRRSRPPIPDELLENQFFDLYHPNDSIYTSITKVLNVVSEYEGYQKFLAVEVISRLIRNIKSQDFKERMISNTKIASPLDQLEDKEISQLLDNVMERMREKIHHQYLVTGKITREKADIYYKALRDVLYDLTLENNGSSYFRNLRYYLPDLTQKMYRDNERSIFEYLAKVAKRRFRKHLSEML